MTFNTVRLLYLDSIKAILIILVIIGHAIQFTIPEYEFNFTFRFIYSFHMPLFFFISGFLANNGKYDVRVFRKRCYQLLVPFIVWAFLLPLLYNGAINLKASWGILIYPDRGLWFLYNLFIYSVLFNVAELLKEKYDIKQIFSIGVFLVLLFVGMCLFHTKFNFSQLCYHIVFYTLGYISRKYDNMLNVSMLTVGGVYVMCMPFWTMNGPPLFYQYLNLGGVVVYIYRYFVQIAGLLFFYKVGRKYLNRQIVWMSQLGASTLGVYALQFIVLHYLICFIPIDNVVMKILVVTFLTVPICYLIVCGIRKVKYLRLLLIGEI